MAYVVIEISTTDSIGNLNALLQEPTKAHEAVINARNLCDAIMGGNKPCTFKVVVKDAATTINTSGSGSTSETYNLL
jgi:hypothetical protein